MIGSRKSKAAKRVKKADKAIAKANANPTARNKSKARKAVRKKKAPVSPTYRNTF